MADIESVYAHTADTGTSSAAWGERAGSYIRSVRSEANLTLRQLSSVDDRGATSFGAIDAAAVELQNWLEDEGDGNSGLSDRLTMLAAKYRFVCLVETRSTVDGDARPGTAIDQLKSLDNEIGELLAVLDDTRRNT